ncbi:major facilitator, sugar transporter-like, Major facilitator superfamily domain protein [Artemisia annua]|uniref:Major facilitator, sugar transporter-like, Major facilitator superfamily domain protein n=1 Tax=Artemisia annua TaxID=35608 RepID=A0A2U1N199_ARTAN|nr:major facilitator, sugar transporter-like, Major facilitator superfamily domain protein [Artemisia annua]
MENDEDAESNSLFLTIDDSQRHRSINESHYPATFVVVFSTLVAVGFSSPAQIGIMHDLGLSLEEYSVFGSIMTIGAMIGAVLSGKISDHFGRRMTMGLSEMFCLLGWLTIRYSEHLLQLMISTRMSVMWLIGIAIPWRTLALIGTIPCLLQIAGLFFIPESPRWLAKIGRWEDCESALQRLRGENAEISKEAAEIRDYTETLHQLSESKVFDLFQPKYTKSLIVGVGLMVLQQFGGVNAIAFYANSIFISADRRFSSSIGTIALVMVQIPLTLLGVLLMDVSGRRLLLMVSAAGTSLGCFVTGISFMLQDHQEYKVFSPTLALVGVLVFKGSFSLGMGGIPWVIMSEISITMNFVSDLSHEYKEFSWKPRDGC